ncbi:GNAT family N-acetyltransferase [Microbulbifer agarilyticus]|uniref:GNAT family N-acetyltransferase n=1 Tax=Microbulbifer agarilyticus TaxID=260552 RepID=UPI001C93EC4A|nr:GNAT family N-acetyltransferase [Microbulbifer agarilyticus]MBY6189335.1 GNAT family N-acetyltransferase [Microbulbifer agarilyticus]
MNIVELDIYSDRASELYSLLNRQWPELESFERERFGLQIPNPLAAIEDGKLIGGLSFTSYKEPLGEKIRVWINALFVKPKYRGKRAASTLLQAAVFREGCLFALTEVPKLYTNIGWKVVSTSAEGAIVQHVQRT